MNSKERNFTKTGLQKDIKRADERLETYLKQLEDGDHDDNRTPCAQNAPKLADKIASLRTKQAHHKVLLDEMERRGDSQISLSDPDSRYQTGKLKAGVSYNVQIAVDYPTRLRL